MPWNKKNYPNAMKNLPEDVRDKAVEIGNALLDEKDMDEGIAIATAISRAKDWAANRGKQSEAEPGTSRTTDVKHHGEDRYVSPDKQGWSVKPAVRKQRKKMLRSPCSAKMVRCSHAHLIIRITKHQNRIEDFPGNIFYKLSQHGNTNINHYEHGLPKRGQYSRKIYLRRRRSKSTAAY